MMKTSPLTTKMKHTPNPLKYYTACAVAIVGQTARKAVCAGHCADDAGAGHSANEKEEHRHAPLNLVQRSTSINS